MSFVICRSEAIPTTYHEGDLGGSLLFLPMDQPVVAVLHFVLRFRISRSGRDEESTVLPQAVSIHLRRRLGWSGFRILYVEDIRLCRRKCAPEVAIERGSLPDNLLSLHEQLKKGSCATEHFSVFWRSSGLFRKASLVLGVHWDMRNGRGLQLVSGMGEVSFVVVVCDVNWTIVYVWSEIQKEGYQW